jgi:hypothetical protein
MGGGRICRASEAGGGGGMGRGDWIERMLMVKFRQPSHKFTFGVGMSFISSIGTNPLGIISSFVHVGFGV